MSGVPQQELPRSDEISTIVNLPASSRRDLGSLAAWLTLLLAALLYPALWPIFLHLVPGAVDPLPERVALMAMCALFLGVAAIPRYRRHVVALSHVALYVTTIHYFSLLWRNQLAVPYVAASFVMLAGVTLSFVTMRALLAYSCLVVALAVAVAVLSRAPANRALIFVAGVVSAQTMLASLTWRNLALQLEARRGIRRTRDFLRAVLAAIPDPIFVLDHDLRLLLTNEAMHAVPDGVALAAELGAALGASAPLEKEIALERSDRSRGTALVKLSSSRLAAGGNCLVGIIRDITERKALEESLEAKVRELEQARAKVSQLQGLLPICMHCGRIRSGGEWQELERYIESHTAAIFSHGLCQTCMTEHYP